MYTSEMMYYITFFAYNVIKRRRLFGKNCSFLIFQNFIFQMTNDEHTKACAHYHIVSETILCNKLLSLLPKIINIPITENSVWPFIWGHLLEGGFYSKKFGTQQKNEDRWALIIVWNVCSYMIRVWIEVRGKEWKQLEWNVNMSKKPFS